MLVTRILIQTSLLVVNIAEIHTQLDSRVRSSIRRLEARFVARFVAWFVARFVARFEFIALIHKLEVFSEDIPRAVLSKSR